MEERERRGEKSRIETGTKEKAPSSSCAPNVAEAEGSDTNRDTAEDEDIHAKLDVSSDKFDPLLALYSPTVPLPFPNIKCFNNIAEYESFLKGGRGRAKPENVEKKQRKARKGIADPERIERLKKLMVHNAVPEEGEGSSARHSRRNKAPKNVLTRMPLHTGSPLGELHRCVEERIRVKVHIRTFKGLRGVCSGFIVAFDKFWNMAMVDVDETYKEPLRGEAFYHEKALTVTRLFDKLKLQESPEEGASERKHTGKGKTIALQTQPGTQKQTPTRLPPHTITDPQGEDRSRGDTRGRDGREGDTKSVHTKTDPRRAKYIVGPPEKDDPRAHGAPVKSHGSETGDQGLQKKGSQPYGRVHTRHINQLFIRGENVLLVNLQPL